MKIIKSDFSILLEAEGVGLVASMSLIVEPKRTALNEELSTYFRKQFPNFLGIIDEEDTEDVLFSMNEYLKEEKIDKFKQPIDFPYTEGSEVYLIPLTENLQVKVLVVDEYHGGGEYSKYIEISKFVINEKTTTEDVDHLIAFVKRVLNI